MGEIRAIPTEYNGVQFRSRLEASWAAHFDARQLPWDYEPEGYELSDGTRYLPDFYLPTARAWAEVKGDHMQRMSKVEQFAAELWQSSGATSTYDKSAPMVLLFQTPRRDPRYPQYDDNMPSLSWENTNPIGIMGFGKRYSVGFSHCRTCGASTIVAYWQSWCRNCNAEYENGYTAWADWSWTFGVKFEHLKVNPPTQ